MRTITVKFYLAILIVSFGYLNLNAQVFADFETPETTPTLSSVGAEVRDNPDNSGINTSAKAGYYPKPTGNWQYFIMDFPDTVKIADNNNFRFKLNCSISGRVYVKFWKGNTVLVESWAHEYSNMPESNTWVELEKDMTNVRQEWFTRLEIAAGVDNTPEADVFFDDFLLEKITKPTALFYAVEAGNALLDVMVEGSEIGQFPSGSKAIIQQSINYSESILAQQDDLSEGLIDTTAYNLNDTLSTVESTVIRHENSLIDTLVNHQTINVYRNLQYLAQKKHQLFGMHDATAYGINSDGTSWGDDGAGAKSDIKEITGSHGAIASYDASEIVSKTFVELQNYRNRLVDNYEQGGVNTICWHMDDPKHGSFYWKDIESAGSYNVVEAINEGGQYHNWYKDQLITIGSFFKGLRGSNGEAIPVIFRPFHEHTGSWFWWGQSRCSTDEYNELWQFTVHYLRDTLNVHNLVYSFSPSAQQLSSNDDYYSIYPGDNYIDIFGLDNYFGGSEKEKEDMINRLEEIVENANDKGKIAALTECGNDGIDPNDWYTNNLLAAIQANETTSQIAYYATWRNASPDHHYIPYPGHSAEQDFLKFYDDSTTLFLNDIYNLYDTLLTNGFKHLSTSSRINSYIFANYEGSLIDNNQITVVMPESEDLTELIALFEISHGATATVNSVVQQSGVTLNDFTSPLMYTITSEEGSTSTVYTINVNYTLLSSIKIDPKLVFVEPGESYQFTATGINQLGYEVDVNPDWSVSGGGTIDANGLFTANEGGNHVIYASIDDLVDSAKVTIPGGSRSGETAIENTILYPNPTKSDVTIKSDRNIQTILIYNSLGKLALIKDAVNDVTCNVHASTLKTGIYVVRIVYQEGMQQQVLQVL